MREAAELVLVRGQEVLLLVLLIFSFFNGGPYAVYLYPDREHASLAIWRLPRDFKAAW